MINIQPITNPVFSADAVKIQVQPFTTKPETVDVLLLFFLNGFPTANYDGTPMGIKYIVPADVVAEWGTDDSVIEDWVLEQAGLTRI